MINPTLFDDPLLHGLSHHGDPASSFAAGAEHVASGRNAAQRAAVLAALRENPGATSDELADAMGIDRHIPGRRLSELERAGLVRRGPTRASRISGRQGVTWWPK